MRWHFNPFTLSLFPNWSNLMVLRKWLPSIYLGSRPLQILKDHSSTLSSFPEKPSFHPKWGNQQHYITLTHIGGIHRKVLELLPTNQKTYFSALQGALYTMVRYNTHWQFMHCWFHLISERYKRQIHDQEGSDQSLGRVFKNWRRKNTSRSKAWSSWARNTLHRIHKKYFFKHIFRQIWYINAHCSMQILRSLVRNQRDIDGSLSTIGGQNRYGRQAASRHIYESYFGGNDDTQHTGSEDSDTQKTISIELYPQNILGRLIYGGNQNRGTSYLKPS